MSTYRCEVCNMGVDATMSDATSKVGLMADRSIMQSLYLYLVKRPLLLRYLSYYCLSFCPFYFKVGEKIYC